MTRAPARIVRLTWIVVIALCVSLAGAAQAKRKDDTSAVGLNSEPYLEEASKWATTFLTRAHYKKMRLNDDLSSQIFDRYIDSLDPNRVFLLRRDVEAFEAYRDTLDDALLKQNLQPAFDIFNVYSQRVDERIEKAIELLDYEFDFGIDEQLDLDRSEAEFVSTASELDELWRKRVKNDVLRLRLAGPSVLADPPRCARRRAVLCLRDLIFRRPVMIRTLAAWLAALALAPAASSQDEAENPPADWAVVIHGGAGVIERSEMDEATEAAYRQSLSDALDTAGAILAEGGSALDAVEAATRLLEDDPKFNAGRGAVFTSEGANELDASIMRGSDLQAGAVASVTSVRHPISLARAVMEDNPHVMLIGAGAERFAAEQGLELVDPAFFFTERRWTSMVRRNAERGMAEPPRPEGAPEAEPIEEGALDLMAREHAFGTVGVVALDQSGEVVAGTSTGGTTAKRWGRVGDSPILGAGTYAEGQCGVSATGTGEYFIRRAVTARICMLIDIGGLDAQAAADQVVMDELVEMGGDGGIVMLYGAEPVWSFNTSGMYRAAWTRDTEPVVAIFKDEG